MINDEDYDDPELPLIMAVINGTVASLLKQDMNPLAVAGVLLAGALKIYKSNLPVLEFSKILADIEVIYNEPFDDDIDPTIH